MPRRLLRGLLLAALLLHGGAACAQTPGKYVIDPSASRIEIHVFRTGLLSELGDNHVILLTSFSGTAVSPSAGESWTVHVTGEAASLQVVDPGSSSERRAKVQEKMLGPDQMDAARYPGIEIVSESVQQGKGDHELRLQASVTVHGTTGTVEFPLHWTEQGDRLRVQGQKSLKLTDFKIEPIRLGLGTVKVRNEFELIYDLTLERQP